MVQLTIEATDGKARAGTLATPHGQVDTPVFMPCGTAGTVKGVTPDQLRACGVQMLLGNTYHLMLRPGAEAVAALGGLHRLMAWDGPILTDSGGFQVFSLAELRRVTDAGVTFQSHVDGSTIQLTPQRCVQVQALLGADVMMQLDECPPGTADKAAVAEAVRRSAAWARRCKEAWLALGNGEAVGAQLEKDRAAHPTSLFAIQQGGVFVDLRRRSAEAIVALDLPGYAVGGLSVGEGRQQMLAVLAEIDGLFPRGKPRYLMGVGEPRDILAGVAAGIDMFDCVLPTRNARNAEAFTWAGRLKMRNAAHARDARPLDQTCPCYTCRNFSRGALRHYFMAQEMLGPTLLTIHNLAFFCQFLAAIREAIAGGQLAVKAAQWLSQLYPPEAAGQGPLA